MKKSLILLALLAAFGAQAQTSNANSNSSANSSPTISSGNSGAESASNASSNPNNQANQQIQLNTYNPDKVEYTNTSTSTSRSENIQSGTTQQNIHYSGTQTVKNVPGIAMSGPASGPCTGASGGVGVAGPGFGVGGNFAKVDDGCTVRENTRTLGQVYQALDGADPLKVQAREAMLRGMAILDNMNAKIGGDYAPPAKPAPKTAEAPAPAPVVAAASAAPKAVAPAAPTAVASNAGYTGNDPFVKARLGLK